MTRTTENPWAARPIARRLALATAALLACVLTVTVAPGASANAPSGVPTTSDQFLEWAATHRDQVALAASDGHDSATLSSRSHVPLASVFKVLTLVAYADQVTTGRLDPTQQVPLRDVERWYWPGTDGGAHPDAVAFLRSRGLLHGAAASPTVALDDIADVMIRFSDNAAADYLTQRVGPAAVDRVAATQGMRSQAPILQKYGEYVAMATVPRRAWLALSPAARARVSFLIGRATPTSALSRLTLPDAQQQAAWLERGDTQGTAADWRRLWNDIRTGQHLRPAAAALVRRHVEDQMELPAISSAYADYGFKGGGFVSVVNLSGYQVAPDGRTVDVALFVHDLDPAVTSAITPAALEFYQRLGLDPRFLARVTARLDG